MIGSGIVFAIGLFDFILGIVMISTDLGDKTEAIIDGRPYVVTLKNGVNAALAF